MQKRHRVSVIVIKDNQILGFNAEDPTSKKKYFFLPGGKIEPHETVFEAAIRETFEETGYHVQIHPYFLETMDYDFIWDGQPYSCTTDFVIGYLTSEQASVVQDADYNLGMSWCTMEELPKVLSAYPKNLQQKLLQITGSFLGTKNKIDYYCNRWLNPDDIIHLYEKAPLNRPIHDTNRIQKMYKNSNLVLSAWSNNTLVGVARSLTDFSYCCYLSDLAISKEFQNQGLGQELIHFTQQMIGPESMLLLLSAPNAMSYYPKKGFDPVPNAFTLPRKI